MQPLLKQKYFYFIAFMLMVSTFLPLVFNNLPPYMRSHHLWTIIWCISLLIFYPEIFLNNTIAYILIYGLLIYSATHTIWSNIDNWNYKTLFIEFYQIAVGISVITYFQKSKDFINLARLTRWSIIFLFITAIMSIISSAIDPMYARNLIGLASVTDESEMEAILGYKHYGGGTYSTAAALMCLFPILIYYYKNLKISLLSKKQIIVMSVIFFLALIAMQIFGNILIAIFFGIIAFLGMKNNRQTILVIILLFSIIMIIPKDMYISGLRSVTNPFEKYSELNFKYNDILTFIEHDADIQDNNTGTGGRAARYPMLMNTFVKNPLTGCYFFSDKNGNGYNGEGGHLYWMNKLTIMGIIGFSLFLFIPYSFVKKNLRYFDSKYKFYYILASLSILCYGIIKAVGGRETWYSFFIILPGLYYLPLLKKPKNRSADSSIS